MRIKICDLDQFNFNRIFYNLDNSTKRVKHKGERK